MSEATKAASLQKRLEFMTRLAHELARRLAEKNRRIQKLEETIRQWRQFPPP